MTRKNPYPKEWDHYPSVTEVTEFIGNPELMNYMRYSKPSAIKETSEKALSIGSTFHEILEKREKGEKFEVTTDFPQEVKNCLESYLSWEKGRKLETIASELQMISPILGYKGTLDKIFRDEGKLILIDWKTSKRIYFDHKIQVIAYKNLFENLNNVKIDECWILRVVKEKIVGAEPFEAFQIPESRHNAYFKVFTNTLESLKIKLEEVVNA